MQPGTLARRDLDSFERQVGRTVAALLDESLERPSRLPRTWFAEQLAIGVAECDQLLEQLEGFALVDRALAISRLLEQYPPTALAAGGADDELSWATVPGTDARIPVALRAVWRPLPGSALDVGIMFHLTGPEEGRLTVYAHRALLSDARHHLDRVLDSLTADGDLPYRGQVISVDHGRGSARLTPLALPNLTRDDLILPDGLWQTVESNVHGVLAKAPLLERLGLGLDRGVLLHGEPGTGKTELVRTIASEVTPGATVLMPTPSMARERLPFVYELAQRLRPAIVVLEDLDLLLGGRHAGSNLLDFLAAVDGTATEHLGVITLATTNRIGALDPAVLRSSRLDRHIEMPLPDGAARRRILERLLSPLDTPIAMERLVRVTAGMTGADLRAILRGAALTATARIDEQVLLEVARDHAPTVHTTGQYL